MPDSAYQRKGNFLCDCGSLHCYPLRRDITGANRLSDVAVSRCNSSSGYNLVFFLNNKNSKKENKFDVIGNIKIMCKI